MDTDDLATQLLELQNQMIAAATYDNADGEKYRRLRAELLKALGHKNVLPEFVSDCLDPQHFREHMQEMHHGYKERRKFIRDAFKECITRLKALGAPLDGDVVNTLTDLDPEHVAALWKRALDRRETDPEGAITLARSLLESVCKFILEDLGGSFAPSDDLPKLYKATAVAMKLAPSQHTEQIFKQILGGCQAVVEGLGALRNKIGDAHGQGPKPVKPAPHHAELAVNLAGAMATFLVATWRKNKGS